MNVKIEAEAPVRILALDGRFDAHEAPQLATQLKSGGAERVVINLAGVTFVDSTALATLVQGMKHCRERAGDLVLTNLQPAVRIIFELTKLDRAFQIFASNDEAVSSFAS